jgi:hypothetical protein
MPAQDSGGPSGKSWRGGKSPSSSARAKGGWTKSADHAYERAAARHRLKIAVWSLLFLALVAGFIVWLIWTPMRTPFLIAAVTDYSAPIPPNAWAGEDAQRFLALDKSEILTCSEVAWQSAEQGLRELCRQLDAAKPGGPRRDLVIVYLSMHGAVDQNGEPCLLPPGASRHNSGAWLRLSDLLDELFVKDRPGKPPASVKKLLVLDANRMDANWRLGLLYNAFADKLQATVEAAGIPNLCVINSSSPGQIGWAAPELGGSVFGYFFAQGLKGAADVEETGNGDRVVSLGELSEYLKTHVAQWVGENRADSQQPMLISQGADWPLVYAQSREKTAIAGAAEQNDPRWKEIAQLWTIHDQLRRKTPYRWNPVGWEEFQQTLLRLEQLISAGQAYQKEYQDTKREADVLADEISRAGSDEQIAAYSLPLARQTGNWPTADQLKQLPAPWKKPPEQADVSTPPKLSDDKPAEPGKTEGKSQTAKGEPSKDAEKLAKKPGESLGAPAVADSAKDGEKKLPADSVAAKPTEKSPEKPAVTQSDVPRYDYLAAAAESWNWFLEHPSRRSLPELLRFIDRGEKRPKADVVEILFLRMLDAHLDPDVWEAESDPIKMALLARDAAERAACPADERTWYWTRSITDRADADRRLAEDDLFVGTPEKIKEAVALLSKITDRANNANAYPEAIRQNQDIAAAFAMRDRALAETPYLAEWMLGRLHADASRDAKLRELIENTQAFCSALDESAKTGQWTAALRDARQKTAAAHGELQAVYDKQCSTLATAGEDRLTLREIGAALEVPLASGSLRNELREKYLRIIGEKIGADATDRRFAPSGTSAGKSDIAGQAAASAYLSRLKSWSDHPALMILGATQSGASGGEQLKSLARQGEQVRQALRSMPSDTEKRLAESSKMLKQSGDVDLNPAVVREGRAVADRLVRSAAALLGKRPWSDPSAEPASQLRNLDRGFMLLWQSERTLKDFWGPPPGAKESYFALVSRDYFGAANRLLGNTKDTRLGNVDLAALLASRQRAAKEGIQPKAADLSLMPDDAAAKNNMSVALSGNLPKGEAAIYVARGDGRILTLQDPQKRPFRRIGIPVTDIQGAPRLDYLVPNDEQLIGANSLEAVALYRGHVYQKDFTVERSTNAVEIAFAPPAYRKPTITVYGQEWRRTSVMFIFDCSGSMYELVPLEGGRKEPRLKLARETLEAILQRLAASEKPYDVGVMVYGRRVGWNPAQGKHDEIVTRDPNNPDRFIPRPPEVTVHPSDDVETILKIGPFTENKRLQVNRELDAVRPLGETPLYLSVIAASREFPADSAGTPRHIVVITDGFNEQSSGGPKGVLKFRKDVEDTLNEPGAKGIQLDIVGFNVAPKDKNEQQSLSDLQALTAQTGGAFYSVQDPSGLLKALEKSLGLLKYEVVPVAGGPTATPQLLDLGKSCAVDQPPQRKAKYIVSIVDPDQPARAEVTLEDGDAQELYLTGPRGGDRRLVHRRYDQELRAFADNLPDPADPRHRVYVAAHLPEWQGSAVRFPISVQNADAEQFSPRPAEAWVQIKPLLPKDAAAAPTYVFYDLNLQGGRPVPVLSCLAANWPTDAKTAEIQLWLKFQKTPPDKTVTVGSRNPDLKIDNAPDVTFEGEIRRAAKTGDLSAVIIAERHAPGTDLFNLKVEMSPAARKVMHSYYAEVGTVRNAFFLGDSEAVEISDREVLFTSRKRLMEGAVTLRSPLQVTIPRATIPIDRVDSTPRTAIPNDR